MIGTPYAAEVTSRRNVILLGDSIGDITMADGTIIISLSLLSLLVAAELKLLWRRYGSRCRVEDWFPQLTSGRVA